LGAKRVLAIEDSPTVREVIRRVLGPIGFEIIEAESCQGASEAMEGGKPDLVIADCNLPGVELSRFLRTVRRGGADVPVLMLSAGGSGAPAGAADVLYRPFVPDRLISKAIALVAEVSGAA